VERVGSARGARVGIGEERQEVGEGLEGRPPERDPRVRPTEEIPFAVGRREVPERRSAARQQQVGRLRLDQPEDQPELADLARVGGTGKRLGGETGSPARAAPDEGLGELGERVEIGCGPAEWR
jgi:hypothetical protein